MPSTPPHTIDVSYNGTVDPVLIWYRTCGSEPLLLTDIGPSKIRLSGILSVIMISPRATKPGLFKEIEYALGDVYDASCGHVFLSIMLGSTSVSATILYVSCAEADCHDGDNTSIDAVFSILCR